MKKSVFPIVLHHISPRCLKITLADPNLSIYVVVQFFPLVQFFSELVQNILNQSHLSNILKRDLIYLGCG